MKSRYKSNIFIIAILVFGILFISCSNPAIDSSIEFYKNYRTSWRTQGYQFLDYFYPSILDHGQVENMKAKRNQVIAELDESISSEIIEITNTEKLDKWVFEGKTYHKNTVKIESRLSYNNNSVYFELAYIITDDMDKLWVAHTQIRKAEK